MIPVSWVNWAMRGVIPSVHGCWSARNVISVPEYFFQSIAATDGALLWPVEGAIDGAVVGGAVGDAVAAPWPAQAAAMSATAAAALSSRPGFRMVISSPPYLLWPEPVGRAIRIWRESQFTIGGLGCGVPARRCPPIGLARPWSKAVRRPFASG